jgi:hypothetical protein
LTGKDAISNRLSRLARILSGICKDIYPIHPISDENRILAAERWTAELKAWRDTLPAFLEPAKVDPSILIPIFRRQSTVLKLAYAHALILTNRQFLLTSFIDLTQPPGLADQGVQTHIQECADAALVVVNTVNEFVEHGVLYRTFWFTQYISFCAIAALYVYTIRQCRAQGTASGNATEDVPSLSPEMGYMHYFEAAEKCQQLIASATGTNSPSKRYSIILDEMKREVLTEFDNASSRLVDELGHRDASQSGPSEDRQNRLLGEHSSITRDGEQLSGHSSTNVLPVLDESLLASDQYSIPFDMGWSELDSWVSAFFSMSIALCPWLSQRRC